MFEITVSISSKKDLSYHLAFDKNPNTSRVRRTWNEREKKMKRIFAFSFPRCADKFVQAFLPMDSAAQRPLCKKVSERRWRSGDVLDLNLRSTGPLEIVIFFPQSDKAKSNFGKEDHLTIHCGGSSDMNPYVCDVGRPRRRLLKGLVSR